MAREKTVEQKQLPFSAISSISLQSDLEENDYGEACLHRSHFGEKLLTATVNDNVEGVHHIVALSLNELLEAHHGTGQIVVPPGTFIWKGLSNMDHYETIDW